MSACGRGMWIAVMISAASSVFSERRSATGGAKNSVRVMVRVPFGPVRWTDASRATSADARSEGWTATQGLTWMRAWWWFSPSRAGQAHDQPRRAEAALEGVGLDECLLHWVELAAAGQALDGD